MVDRLQEQDVRAYYGTSKSLRWFVFLFCSGIISAIVVSGVAWVNGNPNVLGVIYSVIAVSAAVSLSEGHVLVGFRKYFARNVIGYNACIYTYGEENVGVMTLKRGSETNMHIAANHDGTNYVVIPLGGWFTGKPRVQFGFGGDLATIHQLKLTEDRRRPFHVWIEDKEGARLSFGPVSLLKFIQRIRSVSYSNTWRDALELLLHHNEVYAQSDAEFREWKRKYEGSLSQAHYVMDRWIARIDGGDRLPFTKEGQELRELMVHYRLSTLPEGDPRRAVLETPPRRRTRAKDKKSKIVAEFS